MTETSGFKRIVRAIKLDSGFGPSIETMETIRAVLRDAEAEVQAWRECARYDPLMEGPRFKGWDRSGLDRCRRKYVEAAFNKPEKPT